MEKINIVELLEKCPQGMKLDSPLFYNLYFYKIADYNTPYPIICYTFVNGKEIIYNTFTKYGELSASDKNAKCVIFPPGMKTWEGFVPPCMIPITKDAKLEKIKIGE